MATAQPAGQQRNAWGRDHGNFATVVAMPNGSGNVLPSATVPFTLEAGDHCYLSLSTGQCDYLCISPGTAAGGDAVWVPSSGQGPWSSVLYVDNVRGSDTTGQRGNANRPFLTPQAAMNAAQTFDTVEAAAQTFLIAVSLTIPATVVDLTITGFGGVISETAPVGTEFRSTTVDIFNIGANLGLARLLMSNLMARVIVAGKSAIKADGSAYAKDAFLANGLQLQNVTLAVGPPGTAGGALLCKYVGLIAWYNGSVGGPISLTNGGVAMFSVVNGPSVPLTIAYDTTDPLTTTQQAQVILANGTVLGGGTNTSFATLSGEPSLYVDQSSFIGGLKGSGLAATTQFPKIVCCGSVGGANSGVVDFASAGAELPDTATALTFDFRGARFYGLTPVLFTAITLTVVTTAKFKVAGAAANFQTVQMACASALPGCTFTANAAIHLTARGADLPSAVYTTPGANGDIVPPMLTGIVDISAGGAVAKTWVQLGYAGLIRTGVACDTAFLTESAAASDPFIAAKATTGLTITSAVVAGDTACNWLAIWK